MVGAKVRRRSWAPRWVGQDLEETTGTKMGPVGPGGDGGCQDQEELMGTKVGQQDLDMVGAKVRRSLWAPRWVGQDLEETTGTKMGPAGPGGGGC